MDADKICYDASGKQQQILDQSGNPVAKDVVLNGYGAPIKSGFWAGKIGNPPANGTTPPGATLQAGSGSVFLVYNVKGQNDFTSLGI